MLLVMESDGSFRSVIDYMKLNKVLLFDAEPIPNADEIFFLQVDVVLVLLPY